jgi:Fe2+ transport system protein FeoA
MAKTAKSQQITAESLIQNSQTLYDRALESNQLGAGVSALKEMGVLSGVRVERKEVGPPGAFDDLSDEQLERALRDRLSTLGLTPDAGSDTRH